MCSVGCREQWNAGDTAWFEYHCYEGHDSADALAWYHSHQRVTVLRESVSDGSTENWPDSTLEQRVEAALPRVYHVRFADGLEWDVFEDELLTDRTFFERPEPPSNAGPSRV